MVRNITKKVKKEGNKIVNEKGDLELVLYRYIETISDVLIFHKNE